MCHFVRFLLLNKQRDPRLLESVDGDASLRVALPFELAALSVQLELPPVFVEDLNLHEIFQRRENVAQVDRVSYQGCLARQNVLLRLAQLSQMVGDQVYVRPFAPVKFSLLHDELDVLGDKRVFAFLDLPLDLGHLRLVNLLNRDDQLLLRVDERGQSRLRWQAEGVVLFKVFRVQLPLLLLPVEWLIRFFLGFIEQGGSDAHRDPSLLAVHLDVGDSQDFELLLIFVLHRVNDSKGDELLRGVRQQEVLVDVRTPFLELDREPAQDLH